MPLKIETVMWLLPIFFMIHDFEEIIMMKPWMDKNASSVQRRFPRLAARLLPGFQKLSPASYTLIVAQLFLFLSSITFIAVEFSFHAVWLAFLLVFLLHFLIHIGQFAVFKVYVPVIITSIPGAAYGIFALIYFINIEPSTFKGIFLWLLVALATTVLAFLLFFKLAERFEGWLRNYSG